MTEPRDGRSGSRLQGPWFWIAAILLPPACLAGGFALLLSGPNVVSAILAGCLFLAAAASLAYFAYRRRSNGRS
ncbi:UNVERIFIED_ORG: membrane protein implicated in regulation of membrane protease activity [Arthrobacter sp. UYCu721]